MSYSTHPTVVTGQTWTAANHNTYIKANFDALWPFSTAGDLAYATGAAALSRLAIGAQGTILRSSGSAPAWLAKGTAGQALRVNSGATDIEYAHLGVFTPYSTAKQSSAWDGDAKTVGQTTIPITDFDATLPSDVKGLAMTVYSVWAAASISSYLNVTQVYGSPCLMAFAVGNGMPGVCGGIVPVVSGNIKAEVVNANTIFSMLSVWGYFR